MAQQQGQQAGDQTSSFFWYIVLLACAAVAVWFFGKQYLVPPLFKLRLAELWLLERCVDGWNVVAPLLHLNPLDTQQLTSAQAYLTDYSANSVTVAQVTEISHDLGRFYRYPVMLLLAGLAYISYFRHRVAQFTNQYDMNSLKKAEVTNWPQINPVLDHDLIKQDLDKGPWAMSKLPLDFCREHDLLRVIEQDGKKTWGIVAGAAERQFVLQMGPLWQGVDVLPIHIKALLVIFLARISRDLDLSYRLLDQLARSSRSGKPDFSEVETLLVKFRDHPALAWATERHAYVYTVMATLLELARLEGVLASAEFLWLKPVDRRLWYVLNGVGRLTAVVEIAGVYAHWLAEKKIRRRLSTPVVAEAVQALEDAVSEILYVPAGESWRTNNVA